MLNIQITESTPSHMLRAIRAACNELLGETVELRLPAAAVETLQAFADQEQAEQDDAAEAPEPQPTEETDSAGQPWSAELHASTKSKNADGTWKKRRSARDPRDVASDPEGVLIHEAGTPLVAAPIAPPVPPAPTAPAEPIMPKIFALITSQIVTINQAVEAAQAEGFADLGANGLGGAPREAQEAVLRKLEG